MRAFGGSAPREPRLTCGTREARLTVAPFRAWRGSTTRVAQGRGPRAADPKLGYPIRATKGAGYSFAAAFSAT